MIIILQKRIGFLVFTCSYEFGILWHNRPRYIFHQIFCSRGLPVKQFYWTSRRFQETSNNRYSTGRPVEIFIAFLDQISNSISKTFEANLQNSSGRPIKSYWTSSRIQRTSNRSSTGRPLEQKIWANIQVDKIQAPVPSMCKSLCPMII